MKFFEKVKRHLSKYKKAKPTIRRFVTMSKILKDQEVNAQGRTLRREKLTERREIKHKHLGPNLIKAMEWRYMRKRLHRSTKLLLKGKKLEKQKEIAELWMEGQRRVKGASL